MVLLKLRKRHVLQLLLVSTLTACSMSSNMSGRALNSNDNICVSQSGMVVTCGVIVPKTMNDSGSNIDTDLMNSHTLEASSNSVMLGEYVEQIATDLLQNMLVPVTETSVGITPFVEFSTNLSSINMLGAILAEEFIFELQRNGIMVVDYKVQDSVEVKGRGDFIFSRDNTKLTLNGVMQYVLVGTLIYNKQGIWINARIVDIESKKVVSSAKKLVPYFILDSIVPFDTSKAESAN
jgi:TolB-like protein